MTTLNTQSDARQSQDEELARLRAEVASWRARFAASPTRDLAFVNSGGELPPLFTALDTASDTDQSLPGAFPYTRGIHPTGYRGRLWTMRQFAGFGSASDTNARYKFLLEHGQTGLSVAFDFPTLMGYDSDHPRSEGEVGKCGVAISSLADMETLFEGIPLDKVSTSMTINGPAIILYCFYIAAAEKHGIDASKLQGTIQNDILKEYMAQHAWVYPIEPALRLIVDGFEWSAKDPRSWAMRFHSQTAGVTLTAAQPMNNIVRVAYQAMAAALGGTQSLHTNSMDETLALPTEHSVQVALRTQQILAFESGVPNVIDPLGGSYYVEALTDKLESEAESLFEEIDRAGGVVRALETGWFQRRIAESAARQQWEIEQHRRIIVGVNDFIVENDELTIPLLKIGDTEREQRTRLAELRATRDNDLVKRRLDGLEAAARTSENLVPHILECARAYATLYEIRATME